MERDRVRFGGGLGRGGAWFGGETGRGGVCCGGKAQCSLSDGYHGDGDGSHVPGASTTNGCHAVYCDRDIHVWGTS